METAVISSILNFSLVVGILVYFGRKPLSQFLVSRSGLIEEAIAEAEKVAKESKREFGHWSGLLSGSSAEAQTGQTDAEAQMVKTRGAALANARREAERIEKEIGLVTRTEYAKARVVIEQEVCVGSASLATDYLSENMKGEISAQLLSETLERVVSGDRR